MSRQFFLNVSLPPYARSPSSQILTNPFSLLPAKGFVLQRNVLSSTNTKIMQNSGANNGNFRTESPSLNGGWCFVQIQIKMRLKCSNLLYFLQVLPRRPPHRRPSKAKSSCPCFGPTPSSFRPSIFPLSPLPHRRLLRWLPTQYPFTVQPKHIRLLITPCKLTALFYVHLVLYP